MDNELKVVFILWNKVNLSASFLRMSDAFWKQLFFACRQNNASYWQHEQELCACFFVKSKVVQLLATSSGSWIYLRDPIITILECYTMYNT